LKILVILSVVFMGFVILSFLWMSYPWSLREKTFTLPISSIETQEILDIEESPAVIKVLSWNLGFLYGIGSVGPGYDYQEEEFYRQKLLQLIEHLKEWQPDIIFLQEIDFNSQRSHYINQAQEIARLAGYPFVAEASGWEANYVPYPYWPLRNNFGQVSSGGAILSRYPITSHQVWFHPKPSSRPWWYNLFYPYRYFQKVTVEIGEKQYQMVNLHLEAFDRHDRHDQVNKLLDFIAQEKIQLVVGDFNTVTGVATKRKFLSGDDYESDTTHELMKKSGLLEVIPDEIYAKNESLYFTFPSDRPDRRLDYIYYEPTLKMIKAEVLPSALSDHLPLKASFQIGSPKVNPYSL
jgi:endonuclease/exonuclease/phosphatase family metal-dependent hydrolase